MEVEFKWSGKMAFAGEVAGSSVVMDSRPPLGDGQGPTPKHLLLSAIAGCTAMDVVAYLRKSKQSLESLSVSVSGELTQGYPSVFKDIHILFRASGEVAAQSLIEAISLSQTRYCGVSAMVSAVSPIFWKAELGGSLVGEGQADFGPVGALASSPK